MSNGESFERDFQLTFKNRALLESALSHRSCKDSPFGHNERLEFLGDAVAGLVINEFLFTSTDKSEGDMAKIKGMAAGRVLMAEIAHEIHLERYVYAGKSELQHGLQNTILANVLEAVIGAIYLDKGLEAASAFIHRFWRDKLDVLISGSYDDHKSALQEYLQKRGLPIPEYQVYNESGPPNNRMFFVHCLLSGKITSSAEGSSKKRAEMEAARLALQQLLADENKTH